ncbi:hypothetical protein OM076_02100 [Solirubrobacter ginsenosidimutans]|uniref:Uncharacterized protein n=1 Tax=Solirubrobacter ginsenosidimutans TaxID=490573 RepID=A0A9X3S2U9_9ACTN|nr:hypothetical protein [Solirubrobacter ginsenosidimutans]MDA0159043.1 hypothetical protein [Solirubrobacter ginsenosidimutans]
MFDKAMTKSIQAYLQPGEELLNATIVQGKGLAKMFIAGGVVGATAAAARRDRKAADEPEGTIQLSSKMGIGVTTQRLLLFKAGGAMTLSAKELLSAVPIDDVDSVVVGKGMVTKPITVTIRGESFQVEAARAVNTDNLVSAVEQAKASKRAA